MFGLGAIMGIAQQVIQQIQQQQQQQGADGGQGCQGGQGGQTDPFQQILQQLTQG